jgi:hypothetical protein
MWQAALSKDELHSAQSGGCWSVCESGRVALGYRYIRTLSEGWIGFSEDDGRLAAEGANISGGQAACVPNALRTTRSTLRKLIRVLSASLVRRSLSARRSLARRQLGVGGAVVKTKFAGKSLTVLCVLIRKRGFGVRSRIKKKEKPGSPIPATTTKPPAIL